MFIYLLNYFFSLSEIVLTFFMIVTSAQEPQVNIKQSTCLITQQSLEIDFKKHSINPKHCVQSAFL